MKVLASIVGAAILAAPVIAAAKIVDLALTADGRFEHAEPIAAGRFLEVCGKFEQGQRLDWSFEAGAPVDFNIHYHVGERVEFPEKRSAVGSFGGVFVAPVTQHFCWMWKNTGTTEVRFSAIFRKG